MSQAARYARLRRLHNSPYTALTIRYGRRYLRDFPDDDKGWLIIGISLVEVARYEEAEQAIGKAIELCPPEKRQFPLSQMGRLFRESGDFDQAAKWHRQAIAAAPNDADYRILLGGTLAKQGRFAEAEEVHRTAVLCGEGCIDEAYLNLGFVLRARERFAEAADCFREAIRLDPDYRAAHRALRDVERCLRFERR